LLFQPFKPSLPVEYTLFGYFVGIVDGQGGIFIFPYHLAFPIFQTECVYLFGDLTGLVFKLLSDKTGIFTTLK